MDNAVTTTHTGSNVWTCVVETNNADGDGAMTFSIAYTDSAGNAGVADTTVDDGSSVTIDNTHPTVGTVGIATAGSGNANNGDDVTLTFTATETIQTPSCTMNDGAGNAMDNSGSISVTNTGGNVWACVVDTHDNDANGAMTFSIAYTDSAGNAGVADTSVDDGSSVTIDNTHPTVTSITFADTELKAGETSLVTIVFSEAVASFANADLTIGGGTMSAVADGGDAITWTSTFTPTADTEDDTNVLVIATSFTDTAGNAASAGLTSGNYEVETLKPTLTIGITSNNADATLAKSGNLITLAITASESVTSLVCTIDEEA
ncbi:MAG: hypothetical protein GY903_21050, partial [Fuerstiella sp.]|nr:hypothetical protein [Fuerstiella sp.]